MKIDEENEQIIMFNCQNYYYQIIKKSLLITIKFNV